MIDWLMSRKCRAAFGPKLYVMSRQPNQSHHHIHPYTPLLNLDESAKYSLSISFLTYHDSTVATYNFLWQ